MKKLLHGLVYVLAGVLAGYFAGGMDSKSLSSFADILGGVGSFLAAVFAFGGFLILIRQIAAQREELNIIKRESDLKILQTLSKATDTELSKRARYILEKKAVNLTLINQDIDSMKKFGPRLCFRDTGDRFHGPIVDISLEKLRNLRDEYFEDRYLFKVNDLQLYSHEHNRYSRIIFNEAHLVNGDEWKKSGFFIEAKESDSNAKPPLDATIPLDSKKILKLNEGERFYDFLRFYDYPSGRMLAQKYQVFCQNKNEDFINISFSLFQEIEVLSEEFNNWMIKPNEIYNLSNDGFPE